MTRLLAAQARRKHPCLLAGEYVLGVLDADTRAAVEIRRRHDPGLCAAIDEWTHHLAALSGTAPAVEPPRTVKRAIDRTIFPDTRPATGLRGLASLSRLVMAPISTL